MTALRAAAWRNPGQSATGGKPTATEENLNCASRLLSRTEALLLPPLSGFQLGDTAASAFFHQFKKCLALTGFDGREIHRDRRRVRDDWRQIPESRSRRNGACSLPEQRGQCSEELSGRGDTQSSSLCDRLSKMLGVVS